jgi:HD-GYP domain-containing protein (c-di-GMP phosphodiesterase class II)
LKASNLDAHLQQIRRQRDDYTRSHSEDVAELESLLELVLRRKNEQD